MRKLLLTGLLMLGLAAGVNAQKGTTLLYGNVDLTTTKNNSQIGFNPGVGVGFGENWTVGANLGVYAAKDQNPGFQAGPFLRYTKKLSEVFSLFGQLNAGYANVQGVFTGNMNGFPMVDGNPASKGNGFGANITPAIFINVKNGFGVNINFGGIGFESFKYDGSTSANTFGLTFGRGAGLGISKTFGGKK